MTRQQVLFPCVRVCVCVCYSFTRETLKKGDVYVRLAVSRGESADEPHLN